MALDPVKPLPIKQTPSSTTEATSLDDNLPRKEKDRRKEITEQQRLADIDAKYDKAIQLEIKQRINQLQKPSSSSPPPAKPIYVSPRARVRISQLNDVNVRKIENALSGI